MGKGSADAVMDAALDHVRSNAVLQHICLAEPTLGAVLGSNSIGSVAPAFLPNQNATGGRTGREMPVDVATITPSQTNTVDHVAFTDAAGLVIYYTDAAPKAVTISVPVNVSDIVINFGDPTS